MHWSRPPAFCPWYPLAEYRRHIPTGVAGMVQLRIRDGLRSYPRGKSAMIAYRYSTDLQACVAGLAQEFHGVSWLCRHTAGDPELMERFYRHLIDRFTIRFGTAPELPL